VDQLLELAVNVADYVNGSLRKSESRTQIRNGRESGVRVRILDAECPQVGKRPLIRGKMVGGRLITHKKNCSPRATILAFQTITDPKAATRCCAVAILGLSDQ
jgi:hypothetical protein